MKRIGICIKYFSSIFTNGCAQQGYFVLKTLRKAGYDVDFVTIDNSIKTFEFTNEAVYNICDVSNLQKYSLIIFTSLIIDQFVVLNQIKLLGIKLVNLKVGNFHVINCEEFVFDVHDGVTKRMNNIYVDEIWLMPMYTHLIEYIECMTNKPVKISPYVWDDEIIQTYIKQHSIEPSYDMKQPNDKPIDIIIMEPNLSIHKNALPILLILNQYFLKYPSRLGNIHMFSRPVRKNTEMEDNDYSIDTMYQCIKCLGHLEILKCKKVILYDRVLSLEIYDKLKKINSKFVMISNNIRNGLNFIHLECFTLNIPIIHNCKPYQQNGLFYEDSDDNTQYYKVHDYLNMIWSGERITNHTDSTKILDKYHSFAEHNVTDYSTLVENIMKANKPSIYNLSKIINCNSDQIIQPISDIFGIVISIDNNYNINTIKKNLSKMDTSSYPVHIFSSCSKCIDIISNLNFTYLQLKTTHCPNSHHIQLYALANTTYKYVFYMNQNTISYMNVQDLETTLKSHMAMVAVKYEWNSNQYDTSRKKDYITALYKSFKVNCTADTLINPSFFLFVNTPSIQKYLNMYYNEYPCTKTILFDLDIPILFSLIMSRIVILDSNKLLITHKINNNEYKSHGYLVKSGDTVMFADLDLNIPILQNVILAKYESYIQYNIKDNIYRYPVYSNCFFEYTI